MKRIITLLYLAAACTPLSAQNLQTFKARLAQPNAEGARVKATERGEAATLVGSAPTGDMEQNVNGYRVEIFSDNTSQGRRLAYEAHAKFRELYPEMPADDKQDIRYDSPKYTVRVGYFLTHEEAIIMCGKLKNYFKAYPRNEKLPLSVFAQTQVTEITEPSPESTATENQ